MVWNSIYVYIQNIFVYSNNALNAKSMTIFITTTQCQKETIDIKFATFVFSLISFSYTMLYAEEHNGTVGRKSDKN